jgi:hypothetical protein
LVLPVGRHELVESTDDPVVANPGDGSFHPFEEGQVRAALEEVRYPLGALDVHVYLLPFPRRYGLDSAAAPGLILLSPGVRPLSPERQHAEFVHELGHVVHHAVMPGDDGRKWREFLRRRGVDPGASASYGRADHPHEIFAEDFRALFGGANANYSGTIQNPSLVHPRDVPGLADFLVGLATGIERSDLEPMVNAQSNAAGSGAHPTR